MSPKSKDQLETTILIFKIFASTVSERLIFSKKPNHQRCQRGFCDWYNFNGTILFKRETTSHVIPRVRSDSTNPIFYHIQYTYYTYESENAREIARKKRMIGSTRNVVTLNTSRPKSIHPTFIIAPSFFENCSWLMLAGGHSDNTSIFDRSFSEKVSTKAFHSPAFLETKAISRNPV